jgi:hypothetical protein
MGDFGRPERTLAEVEHLLARRTEALSRVVAEKDAALAKVARIEALVWREGGWAVTANEILEALEDE